MFEGLYGLSCVENQVLAFLRQQEVDVAPLYYNSAVPLKELICFMVIQGMSPVRFDRVGRIQDDLRARGMLAFEKREQELSAWLETLSEQTEREAVLILVTPEFTKSVLMARGFRDDHYVRLLPEGEGWAGKWISTVLAPWVGQGGTPAVLERPHLQTGKSRGFLVL